MWRRLIPAFVIAFIAYFVWQEVQQGRIGVVPSAILEITSNTDAQVYIDGQLSGTIRASQMRIVNDLKPGRHIVGLSALGFKSKNIGVMIEPGQKLEQTFKLEPEAVAVPTTKTVAFNDLEQSINNAVDGAVLFLAAGDYQLSRMLEVGKSISLIGTGRATTRVFSSAREAVLRFRNGTLHLKGISFVHTGKQTADVLDVKDATIKIEDCRFTGGYSTDTPHTDGDGIWIHGRSSGSIVKSRFERNALNGLEMTGNSSIKLEQNEFMRNESSGLSIFKNALVQVIGNRIEFNKKKGIQVSDQASVRLIQNKIMFNSGSGIAFFDSAKGTVHNNTLISNKFGVVINDQSTVDVLQNFFSSHTEALYIAKKAQATIGQNTFQKNEQNVVREK